MIPVIHNASLAGIDVLRYLNDPIRTNKEAEPRIEIPKAIKTSIGSKYVRLVLMWMIYRSIPIIAARATDKNRLIKGLFSSDNVITAT